MLPVVLSDFVDGDDVRVIEERDALGLGVEAMNRGRSGQLPGEDHLEGHRAIEADLPGPIDHAHPTPGEFLKKLVIAEIADWAGADRGVFALLPLGAHRDSQGQQTRRTTARRSIAGELRPALRTCGTRLHFLPV